MGGGGFEIIKTRKKEYTLQERNKWREGGGVGTREGIRRGKRT